MTDSTTAVVQGSVTSATNYIKIYTPEASRHKGTWDTSSYILSTADSTASLFIQDDNVRGIFLIYTFSTEVAPADVVTLDKVICCYPDYKSLIIEALNKCDSSIGLTFPP